MVGVEPIVFKNGDFVPMSQGAISLADRGFLYGDAIFDAMPVWKGRIFKLERHLERFFDSLKASSLETEMSIGDWRQAIIETVRRNNLQEAVVRIFVTRGEASADEARRRDPRVYDPNCIVLATPYGRLAPEERRQGGIRLFISHLRGLSPDTLDPRFKCVDRLQHQLAMIEAAAAGCDDAIWLSQGGYVTEGPASNVFAVKNGEVLTPSEEILHGITRETVFELAEEAGVPARGTNLTAFDLYTADEVFTGSTAGGLLAVREVAGRAFPAPVPGPIFRDLDRLYWDLHDSGRHGTPVYV